MKKLVIILVIVGVSFLALLVYGANRDEQSGAGVERPKGFTTEGEPDEDDLEDWDPPSFATATEGLQARFASDLGIEPVEISNSGLPGGEFRIERSDKKARSAKITLIKGSAAVLRGRPAGDEDDSRLCVCAPSSAMPDQFNEDNCPKRWIRDHFDPRKGPLRICREGDDKGILPFFEDGGVIALLQGPEAKVRIE